MSQMNTSYNQVHGINGMMAQPMNSGNSMASHHLNQMQQNNQLYGGQFLNYQHSGSLNNVSGNSSLANLQLLNTGLSGADNSSCQSRDVMKRNFQAMDSNGIDDDRKRKFTLNSLNNPSA